ncbi:hypothetical protein D3C77_455430 [compost metagenome]
MDGISQRFERTIDGRWIEGYVPANYPACFHFEKYRQIGTANDFSKTVNNNNMEFLRIGFNIFQKAAWAEKCTSPIMQFIGFVSAQLGTVNLITVPALKYAIQSGV